MMQITVNKKLNAARISINSRLFWGTLNTLENMLEEPYTIFLKSGHGNSGRLAGTYFSFLATWDWIEVACKISAS